MITSLAAQLVAHACGDYVLQSDWMAVEKKDRSFAATIHALTYTLPFLVLTRSPTALAFIVGTHFAIDRWQLARYVCWFKNFIGSPWSAYSARAFVSWAARTVIALIARRTRKTIPDVVWSPYRRPWSECVATGYPADRPIWLTVWLLIVADNTMHVLCNAFAIWVWN